MGDSTGEDITYREYYNRGGDENMTGRVNWKGYKVMRHYYEALQYTTNKFINGNTRIPQIGVLYYGANSSEMNAYLGRPWRDLSTVIIMESFIDAIFNPLGWEPMGDSTGEEVTYQE
ncbi:hypothetical protein Vadar_022244 [Vaccinium darrowii]|uniref:Uncharacterized protein n=1 Tax=Vaccinium darrowii TaxID=229202 RepID=A0ACB7YNS3_9ERIC|nr:hypothetical protein Vadar_022244 [Vaccinium darrowii]